MSTADFKDSSFYRQGQFYLGLGKLLTNPKSSVTDIAAHCFEHGLDVDFVFKHMASKPADESAITPKGQP